MHFYRERSYERFKKKHFLIQNEDYKQLDSEQNIFLYLKINNVYFIQFHHYFLQIIGFLIVYFQYTYFSLFRLC